MAPKLPDVIWAQRNPHVFLTINIPNVTADSTTIELKEDSLHFVGKGGIDQSEYETTVQFYKPIDVEKSTQAIKARGVFFLLIKKEEEWWPRLVKEGKPRNVKVDWENYKDEDEADENEQMPSDFDMSQLGGMGGMPGMDGMDMSQLGGMGGMGGMPDLSNLPGMDNMPDLHEDESDHNDDEEIPNLEDNEDEEKNETPSA